MPMVTKPTLRYPRWFGLPQGEIVGSGNHRIVLDALVKERRDAAAPGLAEDDFFELFVAESVLRGRDLSWDELESCITDGADDGGIDAWFLFINDVLVAEDTDVKAFGSSPHLELVIFQSTTSSSFSENKARSIRDTISEALDFSVNMEKRYNASLAAAVELFRSTYKDLASRFPEVDIRIVFSTMSESAADAHPKVKSRLDEACINTKDLISDASASYDLLGARELIALRRAGSGTTRQLEFVQSLDTPREAFVALCTLSQFAQFLDADGVIDHRLMEWNVRDYEGRVQVNQEISDTLNDSSTPEDFWWLNNGVTIVSQKASSASQRFTLDSPQIVNGLQTSTEIHHYYRQRLQKPSFKDERLILVRIIVPSDEASRSRICRATNSQTIIQPATLRSTDEIHWNIEQHLASNDYFYERRKNYYKNRGKPRDKTVSISYLAQVLQSVWQMEPHLARAKPSSLLKEQATYEKLFHSSVPLDVYLRCAQAQKHVDAFLHGYQRKSNVQHHLSALVAGIEMKTSKPTYSSVAALTPSSWTDDKLRYALDLIELYLATNGASNPGSREADNLSKRQESTAAIREAIDLLTAD